MALNTNGGGHRWANDRNNRSNLLGYSNSNKQSYCYGCARWVKKLEAGRCRQCLKRAGARDGRS